MTTIPSNRCRNLIFADDLYESEIKSLFRRTQSIKDQFKNSKAFPQALAGMQVALLFQEASTRTRISFQNAVQRMGGQSLLIEAGPSSSLTKGESLEDTLMALKANAPDLYVVRCGAGSALETLAPRMGAPVVNGGYGQGAHPTQAYLDLFTLQEQGMELSGLRCLFVGDLRHSRVFSSHQRLAKVLGTQLGVCAPEAFLPEDLSGLQVFESLEDGLSWAQVYCGLRIQFERHGALDEKALSTLKSQYTLNTPRLNALSSESKIIHPGPVNWGVEFQAEVRWDSRLLLWQQMENGAFVRGALMEYLKKGAWV